MDAKTSSRLRDQRAHRRAQLAEKWRERVMKELERQERKRRDKGVAPQMTKHMESQMSSYDMGGPPRKCGRCIGA